MKALVEVCISQEQPPQPPEISELECGETFASSRESQAAPSLSCELSGADMFPCQMIFNNEIILSVTFCGVLVSMKTIYVMHI